MIIKAQKMIKKEVGEIVVIQVKEVSVVVEEEEKEGMSIGTKIGIEANIRKKEVEEVKVEVKEGEVGKEEVRAEIVVVEVKAKVKVNLKEHIIAEIKKARKKEKKILIILKGKKILKI